MPATLAEKITTTTDAPAPIIVKGQTTEQVLRNLELAPSTDPWPIIHELVARYDAKALRRAAKATQSEEEG